jgi:hypothetical protein
MAGSVDGLFREYLGISGSNDGKPITLSDHAAGVNE